MYRIHFQANTGLWVVQMSIFGIFWRTVNTGQSKFEKLEQAEAYVTERGINQMYRAAPAPITKPSIFTTEAQPAQQQAQPFRPDVWHTRHQERSWPPRGVSIAN